MTHARNRRRRPLSTGALGLALCAAWGPIGCTHNYYYGVNPCAPAPTTVVPGGVCEVPSGVVGGTPVVGSGAPAGTSTITAPVLGGARPPRVVVSEPGTSRFAWRRSDPESSLVTTRVEGNVDTPTTTR